MANCAASKERGRPVRFATKAQALVNEETMFNTLPALALLSAIFGTALLIAGMISIVRKPPRPAFLKIGTILLILGITGLWIVQQAAASV
ncbi:hypothetical protein N9C66_03035 [Akkermansiaceae bacterium]|jgi:hypothetical protein|nr:hypothetical protein [Akkermansiaceae bacterium]MDA9830292.1 hypothetical protein [Akkermansiaceae bacterium]MDB4382779.1 hypothetical protein [Akkermansiaceae bacterium]MDB4393602.1 hypothetical protein [bacterium]MDF1711856.1 hypothetical protein [Akkermansiaceae bacterium]